VHVRDRVRFRVRVRVMNLGKGGGQPCPSIDWQTWPRPLSLSKRSLSFQEFLPLCDSPVAGAKRLMT